MLTRLGHVALAEGAIRQYLPDQPAAARQVAADHPDIPPEVLALAQAGKRANAIKRYQQLTGADFDHALKVVDSL